MTLLKKAIRSIWDHKMAYMACIVLITIGVFMVEVMGIAATVFTVSRDRYYETYRLADVFGQVRAMPVSALADVARTPGVREVLGREVYDARVLIPGSDKLITLRITSLDRQNGDMPLNGVIVHGRDFGGSADLMVGGAFLDAYGLKENDTLQVVIERRVHTLTICAAADSPEYVYPVKNAAEILPDADTFGYAYMELDSLWALTGRQGIYNDICLALDDGTAFEDVQAGLEDVLGRYGLLALYARKDQPSVAMVDMELNSIAAMSGSVPMVFMLMAIVVLYLMLKRLIEQERVQIGVLKAFGYSQRVILLHYMLYGTVTGAAGGLLGVLLGIAASGPYVAMFKTYFNLPTEHAGLPVMLVIRGFLVALAAGTLGGLFGARGALQLQPAEAMRPEAPKAVKRDILATLPFLRMLLSSGGHMAVRSIARNKVRSGVIVVGIMFAFGMLSYMGSYNVMIDFMMLNQFSKVQRYDAKLILQTPVSDDKAAQAAQRVEGVYLAEGILELPVMLQNRHRKAGTNIIGLREDAALYAIYDNMTGTAYPPPRAGVILSDVLADQLEARAGDVLYLNSPLLTEDIKIGVTAVVRQNLGQAAYMEIEALSSLFQLDTAATAVLVKTDDTAPLKALLDKADNLAAVEDKAATLKKYQDMMAPYGALIFIMWLISVIVAFAIIYNTSTISLSERKREYATLRVMGMQVREVAAIMGFEYWTLCLIGILLGIPFTMLLKESLASFFASDTFAFPTFTPLSAYAQAVAGCVAAVFLANRSAVRQIRKFDMVEVLKERE